MSLARSTYKRLLPNQFESEEQDEVYDLKTGNSAKKNKKPYNPVPRHARARSGHMPKPEEYEPEQGYLRKTMSHITKHPFDFEVPLKKSLA